LKAQFEQVTVNPGESWALQFKDFREVPFLWHYHPEFELTLIDNARGHRYVGDSIEAFDCADLVMVGPNQPHSWASRETVDPSKPIQAVVAWFTGDWLDKVLATWPELLCLEALRTGSGRGLRFSAALAAEIRPLMLSLPALDAAQRLPLLLHILARLARDPGIAPLASHAFAVDDRKAQTRMTQVLERIHADLQSVPGAEALAALASLSTGAFHRWFKRHTGMTLLEYVTQLRIGTACQLLISTGRPIGAIAGDAGFGTLAHFNRQFLRTKGTTPSRFRRRFRS
jgi:AraC-like DNA-binding protein